MLRDLDPHSDLFARINHWKQEVVKSTILQEYTRQPPLESHPMQLRSQTTRPALGEVSGNPSSRKRKAFDEISDTVNIKPSKKAVMDQNTEGAGRPLRSSRPAGDLEPQSDEEETSKQPAPRRRGRPPKIPQFNEIDLQPRPKNPDTVWVPSRATSPRKTTSSPSKKGQIPLDKPISEARIDMQYLSRCDPAVHRTDFASLRIESQEVPPPVRNLFEKLDTRPLGLVPSALKVYSSLSVR